MSVRTPSKAEKERFVEEMNEINLAFTQDEVDYLVSLFDGNMGKLGRYLEWIQRTNREPLHQKNIWFAIRSKYRNVSDVPTFEKYMENKRRDSEAFVDEWLGQNIKEVREATPETELPTRPRQRKLASLAELDNLIGLETMKTQVKNLLAHAEITHMRKKHGLKSTSQSLHMVFKGNPGTGKTTVARIIGKIMKEIGILDSGHVVETDRSSFVNKYQGEGERKMAQAVQEARGGVLFIDEAYSLNPTSGENDQSAKILDTLVKLLEDNRDNFICIIAGYTQEMDDMLQYNPGMVSRFPIHIDFPNYEDSELVSIAKKFATDESYVLDESFIERMLPVLEEEKTRKNFSNARSIRNILEECMRSHSSRLFYSDEELTKEMLMTITAEDFTYTSPVIDSGEDRDISDKEFKQFMKRQMMREAEEQAKRRV
jgi:stage V sporulation protein K